MFEGMSGVRILHRLLLVILVLIHSLEADSKSRCRKSERDALLKFKQGLVDPSNRLISWVGEDCCLWDGVGCSETSGHVNRLNLKPNEVDYDQKLAGKMSNSLLNLTYLYHLDLSHNNFRGSIPHSLGHLQRLKFLSLERNFFWGPIPESIGKLSGLRYLYLGENLLNGSIPVSIRQLSNLEFLVLSTNLLEGRIPQGLGKLSKLAFLEIQNNLLEGPVSERHFEQLKSLTHLRMNDNSLVFDLDSNWVPPFQLESIFLSSCKIGPRFPQWLKSQSNNSLVIVDLYNASISDSIPDWFENISSNIRWIDLSHNQITSQLPKFGRPLDPSYRFIFLNSNMFEGSLIDLPSSAILVDISSNLFSGQIPQTIGERLPNLTSLSLSNNLFNGSIPTSLCRMKSIYYLDLSMNRLSGTIPQCWQKTNELMVLDLAHNNLSGRIPVSLGYLHELRSLHLEKNNLHGEVPASLGNLPFLLTLDLSENSLVGSISALISNSLKSLQIFSIHSNMFSGEIPPKICHLASLRILNFANNKMAGTIPPCFHNFTRMVFDKSNDTHYLSVYRFDYGFELRNHELVYEDHILSYMKGREISYGKTTISLLYSVDLSENNFIGEIPIELMNLSMLQSLNLSGNNLIGNIPSNIHKLRSIESLDLSRNDLSGSIPPSISKLNFLSYLNLSFNKLSGVIPHGNQLQTLNDISIYSGNAGLCGPPLGMCQGEETELPKHPEATAESDEDRSKSEMIWFYCGLSMGFVSGFVGISGVLYFYDSLRYACFKLVDKTYNKLWIIIAIKTNQIQRKLRHIQTDESKDWNAGKM